MARPINRLNARKVETLTEPGRHADGGGLYLSVSRDGAAKSWTFMFERNGRQREMGLGSAAKGNVTLAEAREAAAEARRELRQGNDPIEAKRARLAAARPVPAFGEFADALLDEIEGGWRNDVHRKQWRTTLRVHAAALRPKPVNAIETADVLEVLKPIWTTKAETASRLRGRIEFVLDAAKSKGLRAGENPARWRGHLDKLLPRRRKLARGHHAALPYADVPAFVGRLRAVSSVSARALEFAILTAARSGEVRGATWEEIDFDAKIWTVPKERMKGGREHRVPLTDRAIAILREVEKVKSGPYVFPGRRAKTGLSVMVFDMVLRRLDVDVTVHGFRSSFRDWAGEATTFQREVAEAALAHVVGDATERAYRRGDALLKRRRLMEAWGGFCDPTKARNVVELRRVSVK